jgi:hypothetical protein
METFEVKFLMLAASLRLVSQLREDVLITNEQYFFILVIISIFLNLRMCPLDVTSVKIELKNSLAMETFEVKFLTFAAS